MEKESPNSFLKISFLQLMYFCEVHRSESVTIASRHLGVSQPALSQAISEIEKRIQAPLFKKRSGRFELTGVGQHFLDFSQEVLHASGEVFQWVENFKRGSVGSLRVGMIDAASLYLIPAAVRDFRNLYPEVDLKLVVDHSANLLERLRQSDIDLAFVFGPIVDDFNVTELRQEPLFLYASSAQKSIDDSDWVLYPSGRQTRSFIDQGLAARGIVPRVVLESDSPEVLKQLVYLGMGCSVLPEGIAENGLHALKRFDDTPVAMRPLLALRKIDTVSNPRSEAFYRLALNAS